jgi:heptosyltransferase-3
MPNHLLNPLNFNRILIVTQRYLGDTLLTTALIHSLRVAYPLATIDVLLPKANSGILQGNPDINELLFFPEKPSKFEFLTFLKSIYHQYDLAISLQNSDRTSLCAILAAKRSMGFVDVPLRKSWWKKLLFSAYLIPTETHTVLENLRFCQLLSIPAISSLIAPQALQSKQAANISSAYAVLHVMPQWRFKQWHQNGWLEVIEFLHQHNLQIVLSGGPTAEEIAFVKQLAALASAPVINLAGVLSIPELSEVIRHATVFIGPDTGITHLASATGTPCIALFGPTNPEIWAPWPYDYQTDINPFHKKGSQTIANVYLLQDQTDRSCIPCQNEGCLKHRHSHSECLDHLSVQLVLDTLNVLLQSDRRLTPS